MLSQSVLGVSSFESVIADASTLKPTSGSRKRNIFADLLLTALIDAFSILVIFLLMNFSSTGEILFMSKNMELPKAALGEVLERTPVVKVDDGKMYLEDKEVTMDGLVAELLELRKNWQELHPSEEYPGVLTIQADRRVKYDQLSPIVQASNHAGFSDIKFAIVMK
jgi:biopolymer transport protein ExbD